ncbi:MAG: hypothetical protein IJL74_00310 [Bacilli bacterium]|nr:hypothetical protein [Bacilli bacterium]
MDKDMLIDQFIDRLVLCFDENQIVSDIIDKVNEMRNFRNVSVNKNTIKCVSKNQTRDINVDGKNGKIIFRNSGEKTDDLKRERFINELRYIQDGDKSTCTKDNVQYEITNQGNKEVVGRMRYSKVSNYFEGKCMYLRIVKSGKKALRDKDGNASLLEGYDVRTEFYVLTNGDVLKIVSKDGKEKYFYCDSSVLTANPKKDDKKAKFNVELSYREAQDILNNIDDAFNLINNDLIYGIRGKAY